MSEEAVKYDANYYQSHCGRNYERNNGWEEQFGKQAAHIIRELSVHSVLDAGCAMGYLVEGLRDRGVDAEGIDISEYALSCVREDIKPYCRKHSLTQPLEKKYDLITCIEVMEHLEAEEISAAIENLCAATDMILFSSTPFDYAEETHISVHSPEYWVEQFAYFGFYHDVRFDSSFISVQAMLFRRGEKSRIDLIRDYESVLFQKHQENVAIREQRKLAAENVEIYKEAYQKHVDMINQELNPRIAKLTQEIATISDRKDEDWKRQLEEQERICKERLADQEIEFRKEMAQQEIRFQNSYMEEVEQHKYYEEEYLNSRAVFEQREQALQSEIQKLQQENEAIRHRTRSYLNFIRGSIRFGSKSMRDVLSLKYQMRKESKRLLSLDREYWDPVFDPHCYAANNPDISKAYGNDEIRLLNHFICYGMSEGRKAKGDFDVHAYIEWNPDVVDVLKNDIRAYYLHYITNGKKDGRRAI